MNAGIFVFWSTDVAVYEMVVLIGTRVGEVNTIDGIQLPGMLFLKHN